MNHSGACVKAAGHKVCRHSSTVAVSQLPSYRKKERGHGSKQSHHSLPWSESKLSTMVLQPTSFLSEQRPQTEQALIPVGIRKVSSGLSVSQVNFQEKAKSEGVRIMQKHQNSQILFNQNSQDSVICFIINTICTSIN